MKIPQIDKHNPALQELKKRLREEVRRRGGDRLTFEQKRDLTAKVASEALWLDEEEELQELVTTDEEVEVGGKRYRRLAQPSSVTCFGRWGGHCIAEPLYRELGKHNGEALKVLEVRVGIIEHMTPDFARIVGALGAAHGSRAVERTLETTGLSAPSRSFLEDRVARMAGTVAELVTKLEEEARAALPPPAEIHSVSCGMDRMAVRMAEPVAGDPTPRCTRDEPYQREPPTQKEQHFRMAWVGSVTAYDAEGTALHTWRSALPASAESTAIAQRVAADVAWLVRHKPGIAVTCVQDGAPEFEALPTQLRKALPHNTALKELTDFEHLAGYLDDVVEACEPEAVRESQKAAYRRQLLRSDNAITQIEKRMISADLELPLSDRKAHDALEAALSYISTRKEKMRYATEYAAGRTIGSGATENTCWEMQRRVKAAGQSWVPDRSLGGILAIRGLVLSERWNSAMQTMAAHTRKEVRRAA